MLQILWLKAQNDDYPYAYSQYSFINYQRNQLVYNSTHNNFNRIFAKLDSIIFFGKGHVKILHLGASHIQADQFTGRFREKLFYMMPGVVKNRGILFPYAMARTNHPFNYYSTFTGSWDVCKNVETKKTNTLGITGMTAVTKDSLTEFAFFIKRNIYPAFRFDKVTVLHATGPCFFDIDLITPENMSCVKTIFEGYTVFQTSQPVDTLIFRVCKTDSLQESFELYGVIGEIKDGDGITYNAIGVNGASVSSYLKCELLKQHLALLNPDMVILSLGINDVQTNDFSVANFEMNYDSLIRIIQAVVPDVKIIITTNSDSYYKRKHPNKNSELAVDAIYRLTQKYNNMALWDWFNIMGGLGSVKDWEENNLVKRDLVHFTKEGYFLLGDLFFGAFIRSYENYLLKNYTE